MLFFGVFQEKETSKNSTKQWFPKNTVESPQHHDDNPPDDPGRTEVTSQTHVMLCQGVDVVQQEFQGVDVGHLTPPRLLLGATTLVGHVGHLTPQRHKKGAVGKKLTPKKKNV
jgi:hypothetical protein